MPQCCAYGCYTSQDKGTKFFRIPRAESDENRRNVWLARINRVNWTPTESSRLCDKHFTEDQFEKRCADSVRKLKPNAIPSVFEHTSARKTTKPHRLRSKVVLMELIKTEPEVDPLAPENEHRNIEEGNLLSIEGDFLKVDINEVKVESSDLNCAYVSDITYDESKLDITSFSGLKYENEEESYNVDAVKEELIPDATTKDENWLIKAQDHDMEQQKRDTCKKSAQGYGIPKDPQTHIDDTAEDSSTSDSPSDEKNVCHICGKRFLTDLEITNHIRQHHEPDALKCDIRTAISSGKCSSISVTPAKKMKKSFKCEMCGIIFTRPIKLREHVRIHTGEKPYKCHVCERVFRQSRKLREHVRIHTRENLFKCDVCGKEFINSYHLKRHVSIHTGAKVYKCEVCGKGFTCFYRFENHLRVHTGEKPFVCDICKECFRSKVNLVAHVRIHSNENPFKCHICGKQFIDSYQLKRHVLIHNKDKSYKCSVCNKGFNYQRVLYNHLRTHTGEKPFECDLCKKSFRFKESITSHMTTHTRKYSYKCDTCQKSFRYSNHLKMHERIHSRHEEVKCDLFGKDFTQLQSIEGHVCNVAVSQTSVD
ncbi:zinc finger protein 454-like isoform X2 [Periplaneta americana]|uniref:zinc finger protein 454-like isoform X2 n=2 Tax=Periplaneta americana TaxID=6978 RepID=UPI0037E9B7CF